MCSIVAMLQQNPADTTQQSGTPHCVGHRVSGECGVWQHEVPRSMLWLGAVQVLDAVGMGSMDLKQKPQSLSDGFKRRLALAVQVPPTPSFLSHPYTFRLTISATLPTDQDHINQLPTSASYCFMPPEQVQTQGSDVCHCVCVCMRAHVCARARLCEKAGCKDDAEHFHGRSW